VSPSARPHRRASSSHLLSSPLPTPASHVRKPLEPSPGQHIALRGALRRALRSRRVGSKRAGGHRGARVDVGGAAGAGIQLDGGQQRHAGKRRAAYFVQRGRQHRVGRLLPPQAALWALRVEDPVAVVARPAQARPVGHVRAGVRVRVAGAVGCGRGVAAAAGAVRCLGGVAAGAGAGRRGRGVAAAAGAVRCGRGVAAAAGAGGGAGREGAVQPGGVGIGAVDVGRGAVSAVIGAVSFVASAVPLVVGSIALVIGSVALVIDVVALVIGAVSLVTGVIALVVGAIALVFDAVFAATITVADVAIAIPAISEVVAIIAVSITTIGGAVAVVTRAIQIQSCISVSPPVALAVKVTFMVTTIIGHFFRFFDSVGQQCRCFVLRDTISSVSVIKNDQIEAW